MQERLSSSGILLRAFMIHTVTILVVCMVFAIEIFQILLLLQKVTRVHICSPSLLVNLQQMCLCSNDYISNHYLPVHFLFNAVKPSKKYLTPAEIITNMSILLCCGSS